MESDEEADDYDAVVDAYDDEYYAEGDMTDIQYSYDSEYGSSGYGSEYSGGSVSSSDPDEEKVPPLKPYVRPAGFSAGMVGAGWIFLLFRKKKKYKR